MLRLEKRALPSQPRPPGYAHLATPPPTIPMSAELRGLSEISPEITTVAVEI